MSELQTPDEGTETTESVTQPTNTEEIICDNMSMASDFKPLLVKHSKNFDLIESLSTGVDRIQRGLKPLREQIEFKRLHQLHDDEEARLIIYRAFMENKLPVKLLKAVHREFFIAPSFEEFREQTVWSLENAFTTSFLQGTETSPAISSDGQARQVPSALHRSVLTTLSPFKGGV